jgi:hypothetical protein
VTERKTRWVEPPAFLLAIAGLIALVGIGMSAAGSQKIGLFTDDPGHALRLTHYLDNGLYIRDFEVRRTVDGDVPDGAYVYGPATLLLSHDVNRLLNDEEPDSAGMWPYQYAVRHGVVAAIGLACLLAAAGLAWSVMGSWRWAVVTAGILSAIPLWTGQTMFNPKDVPVAAGHTLFTLGLVLLAAAKPTAKLWSLLASGFIVAAGTFLALGTRPGTWAPMLVVLAVFVLAVIRSRPIQTRAHLVRIGLVTVGSFVVAYGGLLALYPRVFSNPLTMLRVSASSSADYVSFGGQPRSDRSCGVVHLLTDLPLGLLTLMVIGTVLVVWMLVVQRRRAANVDGMALVGAQAYAVLVAAVVLDTSLYNGLRQLLFAFPALAVLATIGLAALVTSLAGKNLAQALLTVAAGLALVLPTAVQLRCSRTSTPTSTSRPSNSAFRPRMTTSARVSVSSPTNLHSRSRSSARSSGSAASPTAPSRTAAPASRARSAPIGRAARRWTSRRPASTTRSCAAPAPLRRTVSTSVKSGGGAISSRPS